MLLPFFTHLGFGDGIFGGIGGKNFVNEREVVWIINGDDSRVRLRVVRVEKESRREDEHRKATLQKVRTARAPKTHLRGSLINRPSMRTMCTVYRSHILLNDDPF